MTRLGWAWAALIGGVALGVIGGGIYALGQMNGEPPARTPTAQTVLTDTPQPKTLDAARDATQAFLAAYASGDWGAVWDVLRKSDQAVVSRADYVRYHQQCPNTFTGVPFTIKSGRLESPDHAVFIIERAGLTGTRDLYYENSTWRGALDADAVADFRKGIDAAIAACKS